MSEEVVDSRHGGVDDLRLRAWTFNAEDSACSFLCRVNEEASDKVLEVEQKYNEVRRPVYSKRNEIIQSIPNFWFTAILSHPILCELVSDEDQKVLKYLHSLDVEDFKDVKSGYSITFSFKPNPYFEDTKLVKVFRFSDNGTTSVSGTSIHWKHGMDLANGSVAEKQGNKRPLPEESFFKWFNDNPKDSSEAIQDEVADIIKEDLWPNPLKFFNHDADSDDYEDGNSDDDDDEEDDDEIENGADGFEDDEPDDDDDNES
ncbi:hypothetical protein O6H91_18G068800 [Diphasiastrum complanatum]|uniref:Uncharacterized protein n=1 Tax=Diphasiastrum complanatum TaxID=34168 RepID=A0ACC2B2B7_DIPCM|nr:hypothetical protein O6H91_18G068800 [Diphasiastrum complanatum]